jgi:hypothetical protein
LDHAQNLLILGNGFAHEYSEQFGKISGLHANIHTRYEWFVELGMREEIKMQYEASLKHHIEKLVGHKVPREFEDTSAFDLHAPLLVLRPKE